MYNDLNCSLRQKWPFILHVLSSKEHIPYVVCKFLCVFRTAQATITSIPAKRYQHFFTKLLTISHTTPDSGALEDIGVLGVRCVAAVVGKIHSRNLV